MRETQTKADGMRQTPPPLMISVIIPVHNGMNTIARCLEAVAASDYPRYECIVVDDSSTDGTVAIARQFAARVLELDGGPFGPAYARNRGAEAAYGDVVFFVDADVLICPDTVSKVAETFATHPDTDAVFGSYDDEPEAGDFSSQYKNLFHHFVHQQGREEAVTFWSGCGAVRRQVFSEAAGFDELDYLRPSIEDIELGYRLTASGHKIMMNKDVQVKHLKRWTLRGLIKADVFDRAVPWTRLIIREGDLPNDLNLRLPQRVSALLVCLLLAHLAVTAFFHNIVALPLIAGLFLVVAASWNWTESGAPLSRIGPRAQLVSYLLMGAIAGATLYFGLLRLAVPLGLLTFATLAGRLLPSLSRGWKNALFVALVLGLLSGIGVLVMSFTIWLWAPLVVLVSAIVVLNFQFYMFFASKRGIPFAVAVVPFHLLYYLYSVVTFAAVAGLHTWNGYMKRGAS